MESLTTKATPPLGERASAAYDSLVAQTRAAVTDAGFDDALIGLSGGIDSALTATLAVDALGAAQVHGVLMPSQHSSAGSLRDAEELAARLGIATVTLPVTLAYNAFMDTLAPVFAGRASDVTEENLQARIRGVLLMALSNKFNRFVLATGNLSEATVGYATLYGDMVGSFAPLAPLLKTWVWELARVRNARAVADKTSPPIPEAIITKPPSAELAPGQRDSDTLGSYADLDAVLYHHFLAGQTPAQLEADGFNPVYLKATLTRAKKARFKRAFACPGATLEI